MPPDFVLERHLLDLPAELAEPLALLFALRRCLQRVNADLAGWLGADALSPGRMQMLMVLRANAAPVQQSTLTRALGVSRASAAELIDKLIADGLVSTAPDPADGRRALVSLTPRGRASAETLLTGNAARLARSFSALGRDEQRALTTLLERLCAGAD